MHEHSTFRPWNTAWVIGAGAWRSSPLWAVPLTMILLVYPHAFLVWHGDAMELGRHAVQAGIQFHLGLWLLGLLALDYYLTSSGRSHRSLSGVSPSGISGATTRTCSVEKSYDCRL
jgi:hypothetical protein